MYLLRATVKIELQSINHRHSANQKRKKKKTATAQNCKTIDNREIVKFWFSLLINIASRWFCLLFNVRGATAIVDLLGP
jgi:hypothetical protein